MNCKKVKRLLPLMAGSEVYRSKVQSIEAHLKSCSRCQDEYNSYVQSLEKTKEWLAKDRKAWEESEWQQIVGNAIIEKSPKVSPLIPWPFRKAWAYAVMAVFVIGLTFFLIRPSFIKEGVGPETEVLTKEISKQDIISMTMVSKETGLKIVWFFNKNFELEERK